jgi:hypothetical protein
MLLLLLKLAKWSSRLAQVSLVHLALLTSSLEMVLVLAPLLLSMVVTLRSSALAQSA